LKSQQKKKLK